VNGTWVFAIFKQIDIFLSKVSKLLLYCRLLGESIIIYLFLYIFISVVYVS